MDQTEERPENRKRCELCGREFKPEELEPSSRSGQYLCKECLDEEQSCGCEDD